MGITFVVVYIYSQRRVRNLKSVSFFVRWEEILLSLVLCLCPDQDPDMGLKILKTERNTSKSTKVTYFFFCCTMYNYISEMR